MNEEDGSGELPCLDHSSTFQLCVSLHPLLVFVFSPAVLSHCATKPCAIPRTQTLPSPSWLDVKDKAKGCAACWNHHLFLCSKGRNEHQQTPSLSAWISVLLQDTYLYLTAWPLGCWHVDLLRAVPLLWPFLGGGRGVGAVLAVPLRVTMYLYKGYFVTVINKPPFSHQSVRLSLIHI